MSTVCSVRLTIPLKQRPTRARPAWLVFRTIDLDMERKEQDRLQRTLFIVPCAASLVTTFLPSLTKPVLSA
jgi:hypothetical protein